MSLLEKATIITTPTAHSNGTLHSIKGGSVADFDVVRGSAATRVNAEGLIESVATNIPRIDYTTGEGVVLLEPQSTNLCVSSNVLAVVGGGVVTSNSAISPDGTLNATNVNFNTGINDGARISVGGSSAAASTEYTFSFYAKNASGDGTFRVRLDTNSQASLVNEEFTATSEWVRYTHTFTTDASATSFGVGSRFRKGTDNNGVLFYGVQLEALPYATSYIPTSGAIATRLADSVTGAGDATTFNSTEGVLYAEIAKRQDSNDNFILISLNNDASNSDANSVTIGFGNSVNFYVRVKSPSGDYTSQTILASSNEFHKIAIRYEQANIGLFIDGIKEATYTGNYLFTQPLDNLSFDYNGNGTLPFYGKVKALAVFNEALTDLELECLTKI